MRHQENKIHGKEKRLTWYDSKMITFERQNEREMRNQISILIMFAQHFPHQSRHTDYRYLKCNKNLFMWETKKEHDWNFLIQLADSQLFSSNEQRSEKKKGKIIVKTNYDVKSHTSDRRDHLLWGKT